MRRIFVVLVVSHSSRYSLQKITTIYLNLSKLCPKYCRSLFSRTRTWKWHFSMTSQWRQLYVVSYVLWFLSRTDCQDDFRQNYEKLSKFVKVTAKILSVPFFRTQCRSNNLVKCYMFAEGILRSCLLHDADRHIFAKFLVSEEKHPSLLLQKRQQLSLVAKDSCLRDNRIRYLHYQQLVHRVHPC